MKSLITLGLFILAAAELAALWRIFKGPTMPDRLTAAAAAVNILTFILAIAGALKGSELYYDAALAAALLSFSSVILLAKFIGTRRVM